jgi:hypothetical protein
MNLDGIKNEASALLKAGKSKEPFLADCGPKKFETYTPTIEKSVPIKLNAGTASHLRTLLRRSKDRLHQTEPPNALPASWRCSGQHKDALEGFSLCASGSLSVMAATIPAMLILRLAAGNFPVNSLPSLPLCSYLVLSSSS